MLHAILLAAATERSAAGKKGWTVTAATYLSEPVGRARWARLIPVAIIVYIISFMDRTNIGFAFTGMGSDLHILRWAVLG
jgi:hypothetical protein